MASFTRSAGQFTVAAMDLDGTLLTSGGSVSERSRSTLAAWQRSGRQLWIFTARPQRSVVLWLCAHVPWAIVSCSNGAASVDLTTRRVTTHACMSTELVMYVARRLRAHLGDVRLAIEHGTHVTHDPTFELTEPDGAVELADLSSALSSTMVKVLVQHQALSGAAVAALCAEVLRDVAYVTHSGAGYAEVALLGSHKGAALARLAEQRGIDATQVVAFGDMPNDSTMLQWAGLGVAMANAEPEVRAGADVVAASNDAHGVAELLERLLREVDSQPAM